MISVTLILTLPLVLAMDTPTITLKADDTAITQSCRIEIPPGTTIVDANRNGVIHIKASDIVVEFTGGELRGAGREVRGDEYEGFGVRIEGRKNVTIRGAKLRGFRSGIYATKADGLTLENCDVSDIRRHYLKSTPIAEDGADWLWPHKNDDNEWLSNYGAAIYIEDSDKCTVRRCRVRQSQNGLCLDRVNESRIYDNDCSFLSGWGLAMWRSSRNIVTRNAFDFCVRGYSHGVYNRGQDSAGILFFEQNCNNVIAENSATHGGDGFFGFAGLEALGDNPPPSPDFSYKRKGCNDNVLYANDFSYAPAHGIEMTFSFGNQFVANRLVGNAICGIWGGYCQDTLIAANDMQNNGEMGYGLERGGVNIDSGRNNRIIQNNFRENRCGVHFWDNRASDFSKKVWGKANEPMSVDNLIAGNTFSRDELAMHFRGPCETTVGRNAFNDVKKEMDSSAEAVVKRTDDDGGAIAVKPEILGESRPIGARKALAGRHNIIMTEWGPWDHESPLVRVVEQRGEQHTYEVHKLPAEPMAKVDGPGVSGQWDGAVKDGGGRFVVSASSPGVHPYRLTVSGGGFVKELTGTLLAVKWDVTFFAWDREKSDPRKDVAAWRALADGPAAVKASADQLVFKFGGGGPSNLNLGEDLKKAGFKGDLFGLIARTKLPLTKGTWQITTTSDDGIRVMVDGQPVIDNFTWHVPTRDTGKFELDADKTVEIVLEYFEIDGHATLEFEIAPANGK